MAKELPYFKFYSDEWLTGNITLESYSIQGAFITVCAYLWKQESVTLKHLKARFRGIRGRDWDKLVQGNYIRQASDGQVFVKFQASQRQSLAQVSTKKSLAGLKGAEKRWQTHSTPIAVPMANDGNIDVKEDKKKIRKDKIKEKPDQPPYKKIIDCLNEKAGTAYKEKTPKTRELIKARFNEGFSCEDFIEVITFKCHQWGQDEKMVNYLRPETLFSNKFESYLNTAITQGDSIKTEIEEKKKKEDHIKLMASLKQKERETNARRNTQG